MPGHASSVSYETELTSFRDMLVAIRANGRRIDARIRDKLLKRARKQGMTRQDEAIKLVEAWKRAAAPIDRKRHQQTGH